MVFETIGALGILMGVTFVNVIRESPLDTIRRSPPVRPAIIETPPQSKLIPGDAIALVRVPPDYPDAAKRRGLAVRVLVSFSMALNGTVHDVEVIASEPKNVSDVATIKAVRLWKYEP